jgi:hypothetical protein
MKADRLLVLIGVPRIVVGFREQDGTLVSLQPFKTLELPRLCVSRAALSVKLMHCSVRNKPHAWNPSAALNAGHQLIAFIHSHVMAQSIDQNAQLLAIDNDRDIGHLDEWPLFIVSFTPAKGSTRAQLTVAPSSSYKRQDGKTGIVTNNWLRSVVRRRGRRQT